MPFKNNNNNNNDNYQITSMSWAESDTGRLVAAISEEGESACLCL